MDKPKVKVNKKRAAKAAILSAAVVAVAARGQAAPPTANAGGDIPPAIVYTLPQDPSEPVMPTLPADGEALRRERRQAAAAKITKAVSSVVCFVVPLLLRIFTKAASAVITPLLAPAAAALVAIAGEAAGIFLLLVASLSLLYRLIFPERSLKEFFRLKNLAAMAVAAVVIALVLRFDTVKIEAEILSAIKTGASMLACVVCAANVLGRDDEKSEAVQSSLN